jgi:hypothetical protein
MDLMSKNIIREMCWMSHEMGYISKGTTLRNYYLGVSPYNYSTLGFFLLSFLVLILFLVVAYHDLCLVSICHWIHLCL